MPVSLADGIYQNGNWMMLSLPPTHVLSMLELICPSVKATLNSFATGSFSIISTALENRHSFLLTCKRMMENQI
jgi:hypothetical protein